MFIFFCYRFDCGIFTIKFMELWDNSVDLRQLFSQSDIPNIRIKLAMKLFFSKSNSVDMSLVRTFYEEVYFFFQTFFCVTTIIMRYRIFTIFWFGYFFLQGIDPRLCN